MKKVIAFTDGSCSYKDKIGGVGALIILDGTEHRKKICGGERDTTSQRMEMMAAIMALQALNQPCDVVILTDSKYLKNGMTKWVSGWMRNGWKTQGKDPVKNQDLWKRLVEMSAKHDVTWKWIPGHSGISGNEQADALANKGRRMAKDES